MLWLIALFLVALIVWYALMGRRWLKTTAWGIRFLAWIEPLEIALYGKSETLLIGRLTWIGSGIVTLYDSLALYLTSTGVDLTPITTRVLSFVPEDLRGIVVMGLLGLIGLIINWLRKRTTKPVEIIAAPTTPATVAAEKKVDNANAAAVEVAKVETAKAA